MFCAYAHTSSIWLMYRLMTQWYTSLSGSLHCLAWTSHFFLTAASLQLSSLSGQPFTTCTVDLVTSHELLPATNVCKIYQKYIWTDVIFIQKRHFFNTAPLLINLIFKCQIKIQVWKHTRTRIWTIQNWHRCEVYFVIWTDKGAENSQPKRFETDCQNWFVIHDWFFL